jgi:hypothetical protein
MVVGIRDLLWGNFHMVIGPLEETDSETVMRMREAGTGHVYEIRIVAVE